MPNAAGKQWRHQHACFHSPCEATTFYHIKGLCFIFWTSILSMVLRLLVCAEAQ
jgi:hypothetical protein